VIGIHWSLALSAILLMMVTIALLSFSMRGGAVVASAMER